MKVEAELNNGLGASGKKSRRFLKAVLGLVVAVVVFGAGLAIGRGDINVPRLSAGGGGTAATSRLNYSSLDDLYQLLGRDFDGSLDQTKLLNGAKKGLVEAAGDPYTEFFDPQAAKELNNELSGSFTGIGAELGVNDDGDIVVVSPLRGYPAEKAGLRPHDVIAAVNDQTTSGMSLGQAVQKIRGPAGSKVTLTLVRGNGAPLKVTIIRDKITVPSVDYKIEGNIGYMRVSQFTDDTTDLSQKAAADFKKHGVKGVILDLRGNPGGYVNAAVNLCSLWLGQGDTIVQERRGSAVVTTEYATGDNPLRGLPTVVLIDGGSASASEITAGALRDNAVATLVGQKSFGKGSVQKIDELSGGSELKITIARWYTPDGKNIDKQGIKPDVTVKYSAADQKAGRDPQKERARQILQAKF